MAEARPPSTAIMRDGTRVHVDAGLTPKSSSGSARKLLKATTSTGYLKGQKRDVDRLKVPPCIKPDVCYKQGYLSGYTESSSSWSFFTQWNEVLFRCDGSVLQHGQSAALAGPKLGSCASSSRAWGPQAARDIQGERTATGPPATASGARASPLQSRRFHHR